MLYLDGPSMIAAAGIAIIMIGDIADARTEGAPVS